MNTQNENTDIFQDNNVVLRDLIERYIRNWKWFVVGISIAFITALLFLRYSTPLYQASSSIKIKDDSSNGAISELAVFEDMGMLMNQQNNVENEIRIIKSRELLSGVVKDLKLNVQYFIKGKTFLEDVSSLFSSNPIDREIYSNNPINVNFLESDSIILRKQAHFEITLKSPETFNFVEGDKLVKSNVSYGNKISTSLGDIIITPNININKKYLNKTIIVRVWPSNYLVDYLKSSVNIQAIKNTDIVRLGIKSQVKQKGIDILNHIIGHYNNDAVIEKSIISANTSDFISNRLKVVANELSLVDQNIEDFRRKNKIISIESQAGLNLQNESVNEQRILDVNNQLSMLDAMENYMEGQEDISLLPENLGFSDTSLANSTGKYNELVLRRNELLKGVSEKHPAIINLDEQIRGLKGNISKSTSNIKNSLQITMSSLQSQDAKLRSKLFSAPKKERGLTNIARQQHIKESLYLYLLQKREEINISLGITAVNAKIIDAAYSSGFPVAPNKKMIKIGAIVIGFLIPFLILYITDIIDTKIHQRSDVEKVLGLPILGDIPNTKKKLRNISKNDRSGTAEAFRLVKTNLDFMLKSSANKKVIAITSTIGNEGKTFIATNLAKTLAFSDAKVLLLGLDLRAPSISKTLKLKKGVGVTNYLTDENLTIDDITTQIPKVDNLDLITSGLIPPNPSILLTSNRLDGLFEQVKDKYDYIIIDTPPVSLVTDTLLIDRFADLFVYVVRAEMLDRRMLKVPHSLNAEKKLDNIAILINGINQSNNNYGYGYGYGADFKKPWYKKIFS